MVMRVVMRPTRPKETDRWGERPMVPGGRERTQREDELQRQGGGRFSLRSWLCGPRRLHRHPAWMNGIVIWQLGHSEYRGWCPFYVCMAKERARLIDGMEASPDHGHPELHLDYT